MKKLFLIILFTQSLFSTDINSRLFEKIFIGIFPQKMHIQVYIPNNTQYHFTKKVSITQKIYESDIILLHPKDKSQILNNKTLFVSSSQQLKKYKKAIGALYWKKGRPQIIFLENRLKEQNIQLANYLKKYIE